MRSASTLRLAQRARLHVALGGARSPPAACCAICVVGQAVADGLTAIAGLHAGALLLARRHAEQAVGVDLEGHADARRAGHHRRDAAQLEARQRAAVGDQLALALHHVDRQRGLAVLVGGEVLRLAPSGWSGCAAMMRSTRPPMVSMPSDSGITSSSSSRRRRALPASALAWIAAPSATTSSGLRLVSGVAAEELGRRRAAPAACAWRRRPSRRPARRRAAACASRSTLRTARERARDQRGASALRTARASTSHATSPARQLALASVACRPSDSASLAARAATSSARACRRRSTRSSAGLRAAPSRPARGRSRRRRAPSRRRWRPPRTRPGSAAGCEMSKVPPPRS